MTTNHKACGTKKTTLFKCIVFLGLVSLAAISIAEETVTADKRVSESSHFAGGGREQGTAVRESRDEYDELASIGERGGKIKSSNQAKTMESHSPTVNTDFWFYLADVELFRDDDRDGHFSGIDLLFDVDTIYTAADVYAVAYLSLEGGPWNEYAVTEDFTIFGATSSDDYVVVTELVSGYPTGSYDILIELFDAFDSSLLAFIGPEDTSELAFLPLEDIDRDTPFDGGHTIIVHDGGGGSFDWLVLLLLVTISIARRRRYAPAGF